MKTAMPLGEIITVLERKELGDDINFDFVHFRPHGIHSYRGWYDRLALGYAKHTDPKVRDVLKWLKGAIGQTFNGYKGGNYIMSAATIVHVAQPDESGNTFIVDVRDGELGIILETYKP